MIAKAWILFCAHRLFEGKRQCENSSYSSRPRLCTPDPLHVLTAYLSYFQSFISIVENCPTHSDKLVFRGAQTLTLNGNHRRLKS